MSGLTGRRLTKVEDTLSPTQLVVRWLTEAHGFGDVGSYVASLLAADAPAAPLDRLARRASSSLTRFET